MRRLLAILGLFGGLVQAAEAPPKKAVARNAATDMCSRR